MTRQIDQDSLNAIAEREGLRLEAYKDTGGTWTIGYGHTGPEIKEGLVIAEVAAKALLQRDVLFAEECVTKAVNVDLTDNQYGALVSFAYNIGCQAFCTSTLVKNLNKGDYAGVPEQMLRWVKVHGVTDKGLINRRNSEGGQWVKGAYVRGASITPDKPPGILKQFLATLHGWMKSIGLLAATSGVSGSQLKDAGTQLQGYASAWHTLAAIGVGLCVVGVVFEIFHKRDS